MIQKKALQDLVSAAKSWGYGNTEVVQNAKAALKDKTTEEMLEALNALDYAYGVASFDVQERLRREAWAKARAAIAKAERGNA